MAWAPVTVSWGVENRFSAVRLISPPLCKTEDMRLEIRIPGADAVPHHALAAIIGSGLYGVTENLKLPIPPGVRGEPLPTHLRTAIDRFRSPVSLARKVLGDAFVNYYTALKENEVSVNIARVEFVV
jgi:glutamine synthetase